MWHNLRRSAQPSIPGPVHQPCSCDGGHQLVAHDTVAQVDTFALTHGLHRPCSKRSRWLLQQSKIECQDNTPSHAPPFHQNFLTHRCTQEGGHLRLPSSADNDGRRARVRDRDPAGKSPKAISMFSLHLSHHTFGGLFCAWFRRLSLSIVYSLSCVI